MKIGIAGCGGIGSNIAVHLVRSGVTGFKVADFDRVDASNLNRQFYFKDQIGSLKTDALEINLKRINPDISIEKVNVKLTAENISSLFQDCGIVVEGFDRADHKAFFLEAFSQSGKFFVSASGVAGLALDGIETHRAGKSGWIVGDFTSDIQDFKLYSPKVFVAASKMANLILKELGYTEKK